MQIFHYSGVVKTKTLSYMFANIIQFSRSVVSNSLRPQGLQHARLPCPSPTPGAYSNSCSLSQQCHPTTSSSVIPFSCLQSFPASGSFPMSQLFTSDGQSFGDSASASVLPMGIQDWISFGIDWFDLLVVQRTIKESSQHHSLKASVLQLSRWGAKLKRIWQEVDVE